MEEWLDRGRHRINERSCFGSGRPHPNGSVYAILMEARFLFVLLHTGNINKTQRGGDTFQQWTLALAGCQVPCAAESGTPGKSVEITLVGLAFQVTHELQGIGQVALFSELHLLIIT